jgi:hypothetical protein
MRIAQLLEVGGFNGIGSQWLIDIVTGSLYCLI